MMMRGSAKELLLLNDVSVTLFLGSDFVWRGLLDCY